MNRLAHSRSVSSQVHRRIQFEAPEALMILLSLGLLFLTAVEGSEIRELAVIAWLVSLALVGLKNMGAGLGLYVSAVALYSSHHSGGQLSIFDRPDHAALLLMIAELAILRIRNREWSSVDVLTLTLCSFLLYGLLNGFLTGTFASWKVGVFARAYGIPFLFVLLILKTKPTIREIQAFFIVIIILAGYSALQSILWVTGLEGLIFPRWITDPAINVWAYSDRAGGILMQPGSNGKFLALVFCIVVLVYRRLVRRHARLFLIAIGAALLAGVFLSYSRAAYLGAIAGALILFWQQTGDARRTALKRTLLIGAAAAGIAFAIVTSPEMLETRMTNEGTVVWRLEIWKIGLRMIPQRPLFGYGLHSYGENAAAFLESSEVLARESLESSQPAVHNTFLNLIIEFGILGFALYACSLYLLFKRAVVRSREYWDGKAGTWVLVFLIVYLIPSQFSVVQDPAVNLIFYCTPALLATLKQREVRPRRVDDMRTYNAPTVATA